MKVMFPQGECCDLACYPVCPGFQKEGCLLFGGKRSFKMMQTVLIADGVYIWQLKGVDPTGMWHKNETVVLSEKMGAPIYGDEKRH